MAAALLKYKEVKNMFKKDGNNEIKTLSHSTYRCQYHIVFAPKYRRQEIYGKLKKDIGEILRKLCDQKGVEIIAKNKYKAIEQFENQHPAGNIMKIKSYGVYLKI